MPTEWTVTTLKEYFEAVIGQRADQVDRRFTAAELRFDEHLHEIALETGRALAASKEAIAKSEGQYEKRFDQANNYRAQLTEQSKAFLTREEYNVAHQALIEKVDAVAASWTEKQETNLAASNVQHDQMRDAITLNAVAIEKILARQGGQTSTWTFIVAAIGVLATLLAISGLVLGFTGH